MVIAKQGIQRGVGAVVPGYVLRKAVLVFCKVASDAVNVTLFCKGRKQPHRMPEIMAEYCRLADMLLKRPVLADLDFKEMGAFL